MEVGADHVSENSNLQLTPPLPFPLRFSVPTEQRRENIPPSFLGLIIGAGEHVCQESTDEEQRRQLSQRTVL